MSNRIYYLDSVRAIAIILGIPLHALYVYALGMEWVINSPHESLYAFWLSQFVHGFRMHAFFVIAGFFSALTFKRAEHKWLSKRLGRFIPPFIATLLTFNLLQFYVVSAYQPGNVAGAAGGAGLGVFYVSHLWFLISLVVYTCLFAGLAPAVQSLLMLWNKRGIHLGSVGSVAVAVLLLLAWALLAKVAMKIPGVAFVQDFTHGAFPIQKTLYYFPFFVLGVFCYNSRSMLDAMSEFRPASVGVAVSVLVAYAVLPDRGNSLYSNASYFLSVVSGLAGSYMLLALAKRFMNNHNGFIQSVVDASFSIYLFHHSLVIVGAIVLLEYEQPIYVEVALLVVFAFGGAWLLHSLVASSSILRWMFNGVPIRPRPAAVPTPDS